MHFEAALTETDFQGDIPIGKAIPGTTVFAK